MKKTIIIAIIAVVLIIVAANSGVSDQYVQQVLHAYRIAMPSAFFCILLVRPVVMRLVHLTVKN